MVSYHSFVLKRYEDHELGESASRRVHYHCTADYAKSSKAKCRVCASNIEQNELRLALMLQNDEGYKYTAWTHFDCFWKHPETKKLDGIHEIHDFRKLKPSDQTKISTAFDDFNAKKTTTKKTKKARSNDNEDDEDFPPETKSTTKKRKKQDPAPKKRKRGLQDE